MAFDNEPAFETNDSCLVSDIFYQKVRAIGMDIGVPHLTNGHDRVRFISAIREGGEKLCREIGLDYIITKDVHDVTGGGTPFGDFFFCDMLASLYDFQNGARVLDFGCSTGRVIRNLKSAIPHISAFGCDPRATSIDFIRPLAPNVEWFVSNEAPPLPHGPFDMVFAISVWSHFSEERAIEWFEEFAHKMPSGAKLIFSTHGHRSVFHLRDVKKSIPPEKAAERTLALDRGEYHFLPYGKITELDQHWGMAFIPRGWVDEKLSDWTVESFHPGLAMANQDVYVLRRI